MYIYIMPNTVEDTRYININSQHGVSRPGSGDYLASYQSNMVFNFRALVKEDPDVLFTHIDIANAQIPVSFYNINYTCNILKYSVAGGAIQTLTVDLGNYTTSSLIVELKAKFLAAGHTFSITLARPTGKLTFTGTQAFAFYFSGSTLFDVLGFGATSDYASTSLVLVAPYPLSLLGIKKLQFSSNALATNSLGSFGSASISLFGTVPVNAPAYGLIQFDNTSGRKSLLRSKIVDEIDIQILDENNRYVNFNNAEWSITLAITSTRKFAEPGGRAFSDLVRPIMQIAADPAAPPPVAPAAAPDIDPSMFRAETDLDFFMYQRGIDI
jgi:hypothetical protein